MVSIVVVESDDSRRANTLKLLSGIHGTAVCHGTDIASLFEPPRFKSSFDLMLLSAPDTRSRLGDLLAAAHRHYELHGIILLSDTAALDYSIEGLSHCIHGHISRRASAATLAASVALAASGTASSRNRRWYDKKPPSSVETPPSEAAPSFLPTHTHQKNEPSTLPPHLSAATLAAGLTEWPIDQSIKDRETALLQLTPRQYDVLALLARGHPIKKISRILNIAVSTSKTHAAGIYQRLGVSNRNAAVFAAVSRGATLGLAIRSSSAS